MTRILMVVTSHGEIDGEPTTGVWLSEFAEPYQHFVESGAVVEVASPRGGPAPVDPRGFPPAGQIAEVRDALERLNATRRLDRVAHPGFDGIFMPGGHGPMFDLATHAGLKALIADFWCAGKVVGSVCHGPASLLEVVLPGGVTLLRGRRATGFTREEDAEDALFAHMPFSLQERMAREGAEFVAGAPHAPHVVTDGRLVTGQNPQSGLATARAFANALMKVEATR